MPDHILLFLIQQLLVYKVRMILETIIRRKPTEAIHIMACNIRTHT